MRALALVVLILSASSAEAHCFRHWAYPRPQTGCGWRPRAPVSFRVSARASVPVATPEAWSVEITRLPPLTDDEMHALAVEKLKEQTK
jgi:hypothetical protein